MGSGRPLVRLGALVLASYLGVAVAQAWPLPAHLGSSLTGSPGGDTGVYVWNTWVFRHELVDAHRDPFSTDTILPLDGRTDLSLHNYTVFADLLALPLQPLVGVVAAFNVIYLINVTLAGLGMFLLARRVGGPGVGAGEAWLAGLLFACSPFLVARGGAHFSLAAAAPLPFFVWALDRTWTYARAWDAAAVGASVAWAAYCDPYYAVYCLMLGLCVVAGRVVEVRTAADSRRAAAARAGLDALMFLLVAFVLGVHVFAGGRLDIGAWAISVRTLYTPMLVLTVLGAIRAWLTIRPRVQVRWPSRLAPLVRASVLSVVVALVLLAPLLVALAARAAEGRFVRPPVFWRSSAPGVDLISFFLPNPNHPLAPRALVNWVAHEPGRYEENVASIPWVAMVVIAFAAWRTRRRPNRFWLATAIGFALLAMGPFLRVAGVQTYVPTPWALLRYVPIIGEARMPPRFGVLVILAVSVLFAGALSALTDRTPARRRTILVTLGAALAFELLPVPRPLYSAAIPAIYDTIARDPRPIRVLELPFGIRDGLTSLGDFTAASQLYQTRHGKPIIGGYLSRVSESTKDFYRHLPVTAALMTLSEGRSPGAAERAAAAAAAPAFIRTARLGYVVIDETRASADLQRFAIDSLHLSLIGRSGARTLYVPAPQSQAPKP